MVILSDPYVYPYSLRYEICLYFKRTYSNRSTQEEKFKTLERLGIASRKPIDSFGLTLGTVSECRISEPIYGQYIVSLNEVSLVKEIQVGVN
jgi:hypothetical protein